MSFQGLSILQKPTLRAALGYFPQEIFAFCNGNLSHLLRFPLQWLFLCPQLIHHLLQAPGVLRGALLLFVLPTFRRCSHCSSWPTLIPRPFGVCWHVLVLKELHIKLEWSLKSRSRLTSPAASPRTQLAPSCRAAAVVFPLLFVRGANEFTIAIPSGEGMGTVAQSLWRA